MNCGGKMLTDHVDINESENLYLKATYLNLNVHNDLLTVIGKTEQDHKVSKIGSVKFYSILCWIKQPIYLAYAFCVRYSVTDPYSIN